MMHHAYDCAGNRYFGAVKRSSAVAPIYQCDGYFMDRVLDSVKSAAISHWREGDRLICSVEDELGQVGIWCAVFDGKQFKRL